MNTTITESKGSRLGFGEFVALMAMMTSLAALSTDAMLPALPAIGSDLGLQQENAGQLVVSTLFLGMAMGQLFYGPVSDSSGRKPAIYVGFLLFIAGCLLSIASGSFTVMLAGRLLQGIGVAGPRSVTTALIRDLYEGRRMAQVMSFIATVFILVPVIAPMLGQGVLMISGWRAIFGALLVLALLSLAWFALRQPETLSTDLRVPFSIGRILRAFREVLTNPIALGYTVTAGLASGAFMGYLNSAQQIFQDQYGVGARFPFYFATLALALGAASFVNARIVTKFGMRALSWTALIVLSSLSILFFIFAFTQDGNPALWFFMAYMMGAFFCTGILFGNLNSLAMEPLGHIAGVGAAVVGSLSLIIAALLGAFIGQQYNGTILPLVGGFGLLALVSLAIMGWVKRSGEREPNSEL